MSSLVGRLGLDERSVYSARDYAALVLIAAKLRDYVVTVSRVYGELPDVDTLFANLKPRNTLDDLEDVFRDFCRAIGGAGADPVASQEVYYCH